MATNRADEIRKRAEEDLYFFAVLVNPNYVYGAVHRECFRWLMQEDGLSQLMLLPRGHLKSHMIAVWCAWWITKHPDTTILYVSATEDLATQQLYAIKSILESDVHRRYWPDMIHPEEAKREEWNFKNIKVDHPKRKEANVRDRTVAARSVGGNTTGLHCDVLVFDDLVVPDNAYTQEGRDSVHRAYSQFSSVASPGARTKVVGTRYHGKDIYHTMMAAEVDEFDQEGNVIGSTKQYQVLERMVETDGEFLWPRTQNTKTGKWFGFDNAMLARIRATYFSAGERAQYYAQYYNNPEAPDDERVTSDKFQYYERRYLTSVEGVWHFKGKPLSIFAGADIAYTDGTGSDYTALAVIGVDSDGYIYVLELDQFKTSKYDRIYQSVERLFDKWHFKKMRVETNAGANLVAEYIKDQLRRNGKALTIEGKKSEGEKTERAAKILSPRYENRTVWHYEGGWITSFEEQVTLARPSHDDLRDAVCAAIEISKPAAKRHSPAESRGNLINFNSRFGGRIR